jgi:transcriptional regulator with XRE-family HTH domain
MGQFTAKLFLYVRENVGLSQNQFARKLNVNQSTISRVEANKREPGYGLLKKIYSFSGKNLKELREELELKNFNPIIVNK